MAVAEVLGEDPALLVDALDDLDHLRLRDEALLILRTKKGSEMRGER